MRHLMLVVAFAGACAAHAVAAATAQYPIKPVRVLAGGAAGGPIDIMSRVVCQKLSDRWARRS